MSDTTADTSKIIVKFCEICPGTAESKEPDEPIVAPKPPLDPNYVPPVHLWGTPYPPQTKELEGLVVNFRKDTDSPYAGKIVVVLFREDVCACVEGNTEEWIKWLRIVRLPSQKIEEHSWTDKNRDVDLEPSPTITIITPNSCLWATSQVSIVLPPDDNRNYFNVSYSSEYNDCYQGGGYDKVVTANQPVPGCKLQLLTRFKTDPPSVCAPQIAWYGTGCLTGGRILKVNGDYGDLDITYDVLIQDQTIEKVHPTDFVRWGIGDWVFLCHDECTDACDKKKAECRTAFTQGFEDLVSAHKTMLEEKRKVFTGDKSIVSYEQESYSQKLEAIEKAYQAKIKTIKTEIAKHLRILPLRVGMEGA